MRSGILATLATATSATQIAFFIPGFDAPGMSITPGASIVRADPTTTVMALGCPTPTASDADWDDNCPWGTDALTVSVIGTAQYALSLPGAGVRFDCTSKGGMTCTAGVAQEFTDAGTFFHAGTDGSATGTTVYPKSEIAFQTASVTAGEEKLSAASGAESSGATTSAASSAKETGASAEKTMKTAASTGAAPSETGPVATGTAAEKPSGTASGVPEKATGAAARFGVEGAALLVLAGVAAVQVL